MSITPKVAESLAFVRKHVTSKPEIAVICGSGLGTLAEAVEDPIVLDYGDIPHFHKSAVVGHAGKLLFGTIGGKQVVVMSGRFHYYEGFAPSKVAFPVRLFAALGVRCVIVTNAAGGLSPDLSVGDVVVIRDHIYLPGISGTHALVGPNEKAFGSRFVATNDVYDNKLATAATKCATECGLRVHQGVYACVSGPTFETPAEARALKLLGADVVGMSTAPEIAVAAHCGMRVVAMSLVTNLVVMGPTYGHAAEATASIAGVSGEVVAASHDEVLEAVKSSEPGLRKFATNIITALDTSGLDTPQAASYDWDAELKAPKAEASGLGAREALVCGAAAGALAGAAVAAAMFYAFVKSRSD